MLRKLSLAFVFLLSTLALTHQAQSNASTKARTFNRSSDYLISAANVDLSSTNIITVGFRAYFESDDASGQFILELGDGSNDEGAFSIYHHDGNIQIFAQATNGGIGHIAVPSLDTWHQFALKLEIVTTNAYTITARMDGAEASVTYDSQAIVGGSTFGNMLLNVGARNNGVSNFYEGKLSDIVLWTSGLTTGQMDDYTTCGDPGTIGTPAYWWPIKHVSPETPDAGGINLTVNGTTNSDSPCGAAGGGRPLLLRLGL